MSSLPETREANLARMARLLEPALASCRGRDVFLVDADRTLGPDDTSRDFLRRAGGDPMEVKARFKALGYCFESFRFHAQAHVDLGRAVFADLAPRVARETALHPGALDFLRAARLRGVVFVVTSGIPWIWRSVLADHDLEDVPVLGGIEPEDAYVFGRTEKGWLAERVLDQARTLVAVGDSDVDTDMLLRAHHAVVVLNHRRNEDLLPQLEDHASLHQVAPQGNPHPDIPLLTFSQVATLAPRTSAASTGSPCP